MYIFLHGLGDLRILAIDGTKNIPPWYILLDYFTTILSFKITKIKSTFRFLKVIKPSDKI